MGHEGTLDAGGRSGGRHRRWRRSGSAAINLWRDEECVRRLEVSLAIYERAGDRSGLADLDLRMAQALGAVQRHDLAVSHGLEASAAFQAFGDGAKAAGAQYWVARNLVSLGYSEAAV